MSKCSMTCICQVENQREGETQMTKFGLETDQNTKTEAKNNEASRSRDEQVLNDLYLPGGKSKGGDEEDDGDFVPVLIDHSVEHTAENDDGLYKVAGDGDAL